MISAMASDGKFKKLVKPVWVKMRGSQAHRMRQSAVDSRGKIGGGLETPPGTHASLHLTHVPLEKIADNFLTRYLTTSAIVVFSNLFET